MATNTDIGTIEANANMALSFRIEFVKADGTPYDLTSCVITAQVRANAQPGTPLVTPTVAFATPTNGIATISITALQMDSLPAPGVEPEMRTKYFLEINIAYAAAPTEPADKYTGLIAVSPGGNS